MRLKIFFLLCIKLILIGFVFFSFDLFSSFFKSYLIEKDTKDFVTPINDFNYSKQVANTKTTMVNDIIFNNDSLSKYAYGNAFLLKYGKDTFAITAKHILTLAKTTKMKTVQLSEEIREWRMHPKEQKEEFIVVDRLLNTSELDSLDWGFMARQGKQYADWLVFSIKQNHSKIIPLEIRSTSLEKGEILFVNGWTFNDKNVETPRYKYEYYGDFGANFTMMPLIARENEFGLSGSPVIDQNNLLVGIVSSTTIDSITKKRLNAPSKITHLKKILNNLK